MDEWDVVSGDRNDVCCLHGLSCGILSSLLSLSSCCIRTSLDLSEVWNGAVEGMYLIRPCLKHTSTSSAYLCPCLNVFTAYELSAPHIHPLDPYLIPLARSPDDDLFVGFLSSLEVVHLSSGYALSSERLCTLCEPYYSLPERTHAPLPSFVRPLPRVHMRVDHLNAYCIFVPYSNHDARTDGDRTYVPLPLALALTTIGVLSPSLDFSTKCTCIFLRARPFAPE